MSITFRINEDKALEAVVYIANLEPRIDIYHTVKTMFFADKWHLNKYARPVLGDTYMKMNNGPVPSLIKDIIGKTNFLSLDMLEKISLAFETKGKNKNIIPKRAADLSLFSESDIECINEALEYCKDKSFSELCNITHQEKAWLNANMNGSMDYELLIDDDNPNKDDIIEDLRESASYLVI